MRKRERDIKNPRQFRHTHAPLQDPLVLLHKSSMNFIKKFRTRKSFKPGHSNKLHLPKDNAQEQQTQQLQQAPIQVPEPEPKPSDEQVEVATTIDSMASTLTFKPLHPTFGAEVQGVDFSVPIEDQLLVEQIKKAVAKVRNQNYIPMTRSGLTGSTTTISMVCASFEGRSWTMRGRSRLPGVSAR